MDILRRLFEQHFGAPAQEVEPLRTQLGASDRKLFRLADAQHRAVGVLYGIGEENVAFVEFSRHFRRKGLPVPEIYAGELAQGAYLEQDLGDTTLYGFLSRNRPGGDIAPQAVDAYRKVVALLPRFQVEAARGFPYKFCYPRRSFDRQSIAWDLNFFKYYFLQLSATPFHEQGLEADFRRLTSFLLEADRQYFLYRDFQSRNIMLCDGGPYFLDYQGGRKGALQYDIASLLFDGKADLPPALRQQLLEEYLHELSRYTKVDRDGFMRHYYGYVYLRIMQALGAYGLRGFYERKSHFLQSIPYALKNLRWLQENVELPIALPALMNAVSSMASSERLGAFAAAPEKLTVRILSFSFHRGVPQDNSGHGGGFVFDARSLPNPGREERFKRLTGRDAAVIDYLAQHDSVRQFAGNAAALVDASVDNYQQRGFKNLMVAFGCTGGQHRSVYLAEEMAKHLRARNDIEVVVQHRECEP
ncbi:MAG TPA: RNase adapter RapZ [Candidatus Bathyarchaeia archaeon]|nr:RNase adapter RapZ [Candidatus Bathyarchaeia archaeon]